MKKDAWTKKIKESCETAGTYQKIFDSVISSLATILEQRDAAMEQYMATGAHPVVTHTNKSGAVNPAKNPCLVMWCDLNAQALAYWRDLGLTPAGLKKINEKAMKGKQKSSFADILKDEFAK